MRSKSRRRDFISYLLAAGFSFAPVSHCKSTNHQQDSPDHGSIARGESFKKGLAALQADRPEAALVELTAAEREDPHDARIHNFRGIVLARLRQNGEAVREYEEAIRLDPRMEDAYRNLGYLEWTEHNLERARDALVRALELSPPDSFAHYYLGRVRLDGKAYAEAFQELALSNVPWPAEPNFLMEAATGYLELGRQEDARKILHQLEQLSLVDTQSVHVASLLLLAHQDESAIHLLQKVSDRKSAAPTPWAQFDLALAYLLAGRYEEAADQAHNFIGALHSTESQSGQTAPAWSLAGIAYARLGRSDRSVTDLRRATALAPAREEHWLNLTRELMGMSRYREAISAVQDGLVANPDSYALHLRLGAAEFAAGHYDQAETVFRILVEAGDPLPTSYIGLAQVLLRTGRAEEAVSELSAAQLKLGPNFLFSYFRGLSLARAGKQLEAMSAFQEGARLGPGGAEVHLELGKTELAVGRVNDAIVELEESLRLSPGNVQSRRLLSRAYRRAGDTERAASYADTSMEPPPAAEGDLLDDFVLPEWQMPEEGKKG